MSISVYNGQYGITTDNVEELLKGARAGTIAALCETSTENAEIGSELRRPQNLH